MKMTHPRVAFWLIPQQPERSRLRQWIDDLAARYDAPAFDPHLTIYSCHRTRQQHELAVLAALARRFAPLRLSVQGLDSGRSLTRSVFLMLQTNRVLARLHDTLHHNVPQPSRYRCDPHISLLYRLLPTPLPGAEAMVADFDLATIRFDELRAVAIPETLQTAQDLIGWQPLLSCRLASGVFADTIIDKTTIANDADARR
jgi:putative hydrolase of the HAD superfamily